MRKYAISTVLSLAALALPAAALAQTASMPPSAAPSTYYVLPGQTLTFAGYHFPANEAVAVAGPGGTIATVNSGASGSFAGAAAYVVPFAYEHSTQIFSVGGIPLSIVIGTFYPNLAPTAYFVAPSAEMGATATGFAPGETVALYMNSTFVVEGAANAQGNLYFYFPAPNSGAKFTLEAVGINSGTHALRTVTLW